MAGQYQLLALFMVLYITDAAHVRFKPVYEKSIDNAPSSFGNPMSGLSHSELRQRAKIHVENQQLRFNAEKSRKQKAMSQRIRDTQPMDSYMKAYREQHDGFQREAEKKQQKTKSINLKLQRAQLPRSKRVHNQRDLVSLTEYERDASSNGISQYTLSPDYLKTPLQGGFNPIPDPELPKYMAVHPEAKVFPTIVTPTATLSPYSIKGQVDSLTALLGKSPNDQLRGFNELLSPTLSSVDQEIESAKAASARAAAAIKKYDYVPYESQDYEQAYVDSIHYFVPAKDHTPINEHVHDVVDTRKPAPYFPYTEAPSVQTSTNYYKVEVASEVVSEPQHSGVKFEGGSYGADHENLKYASQYEFGYRVSDPHSGNDFGHQEVSNGDSAKGSYHVLLPDGRLQRVSYYAGPSGYHANVSYQ